MVRRGDQEGAGFLSNPVRRGNNSIRAPTQHLVAFIEIAFISILSRRLVRLETQEINA
jgi:hypothetical protein